MTYPNRVAYTCKHSNQLQGEGRVLSLDEKKALVSGEVYIKAKCGHFLRVKVHGKAKIWKRNPERVQIPYKYGMYEYGYITENDIVKVQASTDSEYQDYCQAKRDIEEEPLSREDFEDFNKTAEA